MHYFFEDCVIDRSLSVSTIDTQSIRTGFMCVNSMTIRFPAKEARSIGLAEAQCSFFDGGPSQNEFSRGREKLVQKLQRLLSDNPTVKSFSIHQIIAHLDDETGAGPATLFSAASIFDPCDIEVAAGAVCGGLGFAMATRSTTRRIPRAILRRRIPRNALSLLIHAVTAALNACDRVTRQRWNWVFHPVMQVALGVMIFLLAVASMTPIIGGGAQHAASTFIMSVGMAERDGLMVVIGALTGMAALALAAISLSSGRKLWDNVKDWLLRCARSLRLTALAHVLDRCHDGLGNLARVRWGTLFLAFFEQDDGTLDTHRRTGAGRLKARARRSHFAAMRACR